MEFSLEINVDGAAFSPNPGLEVARILRALAGRLEHDLDEDSSFPLMDDNGNRVGDAETTGEPLLTLAGWIEDNRAMIDEAAGETLEDDDEREQWVSNCEGLYSMAREAGVNI
jgi:hypothetical protein